MASRRLLSRGGATSAAGTPPRMTAEHYDYLVIGGGSGGVSSARRAATYDAKVRQFEYSVQQYDPHYYSTAEISALRMFNRDKSLIIFHS